MGQTISSSFIWSHDPASASTSIPTAPSAEEDDSTNEHAGDGHAGGGHAGECERLAFPIQLLSEHARVPERATRGSAGYDLSASEAVVLPPRARVLVPTGTALVMQDGAHGLLPPDTTIEGCIRGRSGLAKSGIDVFCGTIDADYRGEVKVLMINNTDEERRIEVRERIAQLVFGVVLTPTLVEHADDVAVAFATDRGGCGFGSTGTGGEEETEAEGDGGGERV